MEGGKACHKMPLKIMGSWSSSNTQTLFGGLSSSGNKLLLEGDRICGLLLHEKLEYWLVGSPRPSFEPYWLYDTFHGLHPTSQEPIATCVGV